jgi:hypothetical protein
LDEAPRSVLRPKVSTDEIMQLDAVMLIREGSGGRTFILICGTAEVAIRLEKYTQTDTARSCLSLRKSTCSILRIFYDP